MQSLTDKEMNSLKGGGDVLTSVICYSPTGNAYYAAYQMVHVADNTYVHPSYSTVSIPLQETTIGPAGTSLNDWNRMISDPMWSNLTPLGKAVSIESYKNAHPADTLHDGRPLP